MNKTLKFSMLPLLAIMAACQSNDAPSVVEEVNGDQVITLTVADAKSRAGRELESSAVGQSIENIKIVLVDDANKVVWTKDIDKWMTEDSEVYEYGRQTIIEIPKDEYRMMSGSLYHAYAIGYSNDSDYDLSYFKALKVDDTFTDNQKIKISSTSAKAEEIFAGDCTVEGNVGGVRISLVLNRQVAGTFGYLTKVPFVKDKAGHIGRYLILTASNAQNEMMLGKFDNVNAANPYAGNYVVSGTKAAESNVVYTIDLSDWFKELVQAYDEDGRSTGLIKVDDNWKGEKSKYRVGSVFGSAFIMPFAKTDAASFELHLCYDNNVSTSIRNWKVTMPETSAQLSPYTVWTANGANWTSASVTDDIYVYNVLRNHLYGIGVKESNILPGWNPDKPDEPVDPDDGDDPEPINNKQELIISVNHNWSAIFNMGVE